MLYRFSDFHNLQSTIHDDKRKRSGYFPQFPIAKRRSLRSVAFTFILLPPLMFVPAFVAFPTLMLTLTLMFTITTVMGQPCFVASRFEEEVRETDVLASLSFVTAATATAIAGTTAVTAADPT